MAKKSKIRVLLVDDEEDFAYALKARLDRRGYMTDVALCGTDAIQKVREEEFDVVVLDIKMPNMDGLEVMRHIRSYDKDVQIIMLTGHGTVGTGIEGMTLGAGDFLQKPVDFEVLCLAINSLGAMAAHQRVNKKGGKR